MMMHANQEKREKREKEEKREEKCKDMFLI